MVESEGERGVGSGGELWGVMEGGGSNEGRGAMEGGREGGNGGRGNDEGRGNDGGRGRDGVVEGGRALELPTWARRRIHFVVVCGRSLCPRALVVRGELLSSGGRASSLSVGGASSACA